MANSSADHPPRRYEKGERRFKHVGTGDQPEIVFDDHDPKKWVGKCPKAIGEAERVALLGDAIPGSNGDRELALPKKLYAVRDGAIYEAQTSDHGWSYHAYPYKGKLGAKLISRLAERADRDGCRGAFDAWVKRYIESHGT